MWEPVLLADDDAEDAGDTSGEYRATVARGHSAVVRAKTLAMRGVPEIYDERPSPALPLDSLSSVPRHSRSAVPPTCSTSSYFYDWRTSTSNRKSSLRSQLLNDVASPESKADWRLSVDCVPSATEQIVFPAGFDNAESHRLR